MKAKIDAESVKECCLPLGLFILITYSTQGSLPKGGTALGSLGTPLSIINQECAPQTCHRKI